MNRTKLKQDVNVIRNYFTKKAFRLESHLLDACRRTDEPVALGALTELLDVGHMKRVSEAVAGELPSDPVVATYMMSTLSIQEVCTILTKTRNEDLRFATGLVVAPKTYAVTRFLQFELKRKSPVFAEGQQRDVARLMIGLHNANHKLFMTWHSHPGTGPSSTRPSSTDMDFHRRLESGNYPVIGAIVNRQGYVRFFSYKRPFELSIYGTGLEVIDEKQHVYKLSNISAV